MRWIPFIPLPTSPSSTEVNATRKVGPGKCQHRPVKVVTALKISHVQNKQQLIPFSPISFCMHFSFYAFIYGLSLLFSQKQHRSLCVKSLLDQKILKARGCLHKPKALISGPWPLPCKIQNRYSLKHYKQISVECLPFLKGITLPSCRELSTHTTCTE